MNSLELFWNSKRLTQEVQKALLEYLKKKTGAAIEAKDPVYREAADPFEVASMGMLRLNHKRTTSAILVGFSKPGNYESFHALMVPTDPAAKHDPRALEAEFMQALFRAIDPELKANQVNVDVNSAFFLHQKLLCGWDKVKIKQSVQLPFMTPKGEITFEIPAFDAGFHHEKVCELFGFPETTKIMVVDDSATTRKFSRYFLAMMGFQNIEECVDGQAALSKLLGSRPPFDLVIADWHMPNMTGIELLRKVRSIAEIKSLPVVLVTGERNKGEVANAIKEGVSGYVVKPFDQDMLFKALKRAHTVMTAVLAKKAA